MATALNGLRHRLRCFEDYTSKSPLEKCVNSHYLQPEPGFLRLMTSNPFSSPKPKPRERFVVPPKQRKDHHHLCEAICRNQCARAFTRACNPFALCNTKYLALCKQYCPIQHLVRFHRPCNGGTFCHRSKKNKKKILHIKKSCIFASSLSRKNITIWNKKTGQYQRVVITPILFQRSKNLVFIVSFMIMR